MSSRRNTPTTTLNRINPLKNRGPPVNKIYTQSIDEDKNALIKNIQSTQSELNIALSEKNDEDIDYFNTRLETLTNKFKKLSVKPPSTSPPNTRRPSAQGKRYKLKGGRKTRKNKKTRSRK
jgi:hypothetical protein